MIDNFLDLTMGLKTLLAGTQLLESKFILKEFAKRNHLQEENLQSNIFNFTKDIENYASNLQYYINNHTYYKENLLSDKFFNGEVFRIRERAVKSLNALLRTAQNTENDQDRNDLLRVVTLLRNTVNTYIDVVIDLLENDPKYQKYKKNPNYIEEYQLVHI